MIRIIMFRSWFAQCIIWCKRPCLMWTLFRAKHVSFMIRLITFRSSENTALVNYHFQKRWIAHSLWRNQVFGSPKIKSHALPLSLFCNGPSPREFEMNTENWTSVENCQSIFLREKTFAINGKLIKFFFNLSKNVLFYQVICSRKKNNKNQFLRRNGGLMLLILNSSYRVCKQTVLIQVPSMRSTGRTL